MRTGLWVVQRLFDSQQENRIPDLHLPQPCFETWVGLPIALALFYSCSFLLLILNIRSLDSRPYVLTCDTQNKMSLEMIYENLFL